MKKVSWLAARVWSPAVPSSAGSSAASALRVCTCRLAFYSHRCIPAGASRLARNGSPDPARSGSRGSVTDRTRRGTGPEIGPGRENGGTGHASAGIGRGVGRRGIALFGGGRRQGSVRDHASARRRGATNGGAPAHHADSALHHHDADSARRRRSRRGANRRAGPCRPSSRPSRRPPCPTAPRRSTR